MEIKSTKQVVEDFGLKILVHGPPGAGKTRLCATTGDLEHTLIISAEGGLLSIKEWDIDVVQVTSIRDVYEVYEFLKKGEHDYRWVCLDSISEIAEVVLQGEKMRSRDARRAYGEMADTVFDLLRGFRNLPFHVVMLAKQGREEMEGRMLFAPMLPGRQLTLNIAYLFDEVFALRVEQNQEGELKRVLQTGKSRSYEAKDRSGRLAMYEEPDLSIIRKKIEGVFGENDEVEQDDQEDGAIQTSAINGKQRIAASASDGQRTMTIEARVKASRASTPRSEDVTAAAQEEESEEVDEVSDTQESASPRKEVEEVTVETDLVAKKEEEEEEEERSVEAGERARELRREYLRRRVYMLLKEAELEKEEILDYIAARCQRDAGGEDVSRVAVAIFEGWARELEVYDRDEERAEHVLDMIARWKAWLKKQGSDESAA